MLENIPIEFITQEMCEKAVKKDPSNFKYIPDCFKTQEMCKNIVNNHLWYIEYVPFPVKIEICF